MLGLFAMMVGLFAVEYSPLIYVFAAGQVRAANGYI
jgi:hypothetical protein